MTAEGPLQWARTIARTAVGSAADSPFVQVTKARSVEVKLDRKVLYELDGGDRTKVKAFEVEVEPGAVSVCVPGTGSGAFGFRRTGNRRVPPESTEERHLVSVSQVSETASSAKAAGKAAGNDVVNSRAFEVLSRAGFVARGAVYAIIGVLAFRLAIGQGGKITNQQGAFHTVAHQSFGHVLLVLLRSGSAATPSGGSSAPASAMGPKAPTADSTASRRWPAVSPTASCASSPSRC